MASKNDDVILLAPSEREQAASVLARAFKNDPPTNFIISEGEQTYELWTRLFAYSVKAGLIHGKAYTTDSVGGVAIWFEPGTKVSVWGQMKLGMWHVPFLLGYQATRRMAALVETIEWMHKRHARADHWYLNLLGVDPSAQGRGVGSALMRPVLAKADGSGLDCYLETGKEANLDFYARHGFEVMGERPIPGGGPMMWGLLRKPGKQE